MGKIKFGLAALPGKPPDYYVDLAKRCEDLGFDSFWFPDHLLFTTIALALDAWIVLTAAAVKTERITLASLSDPHRLHPAVFAQRLATVDQLSHGRVTLGVGAGESMNLDPFGIRWDKRVSRMIESIELMRRLWRSDEPFNYDGVFYNFEKAYIEVKPFDRKRDIPVYVAANGPRTRRFVGESANGWVPMSMPPALFNKYLKEVEEGARGVNRSMDEVDTCIWVYSCLAGSVDDAYKVLEPFKHVLIWPEFLPEAGYNFELPEEYRGLHYTTVLPTDTEAKKKFREMGKLFTKEMILDFCIIGSKEDVRKRIGEYVEGGVKHLILCDFSPNQEEALRVFGEEIFPEFKF